MEKDFLFNYIVQFSHCITWGDMMWCIELYFALIATLITYYFIMIIDY